jgi:hypothetical protein
MMIPAPTPQSTLLPWALRWLEDPLPGLDYRAMGEELGPDDRELLERYVKNIEKLGSMRAPHGWHPMLATMMVGRKVELGPDGRRMPGGEPFHLKPEDAEFVLAFIGRLRKLYLAKDQVTFHRVRNVLGQRAPHGHQDAAAFQALLRQLQRDCSSALAGEGATVCLHGPDGKQIRAEVFFDAWLHDEEFHEKLTSNPKRSDAWNAFPDPLTKAVFLNTAFDLFAVYGRLGRVAAEVMGRPLSVSLY